MSPIDEYPGTDREVSLEPARAAIETKLGELGFDKHRHSRLWQDLLTGALQPILLLLHSSKQFRDDELREYKGRGSEPPKNLDQSMAAKIGEAYQKSGNIPQIPDAPPIQAVVSYLTGIGAAAVLGGQHPRQMRNNPNAKPQAEDTTPAGHGRSEHPGKKSNNPDGSRGR